LGFLKQRLQERYIVLYLRQCFQNLIVGEITLLNSLVKKCVEDFHFIGQWIVQIISHW